MSNLKEMIALAIFHSYLNRHGLEGHYGSYDALWKSCIEDAEYALEKNEESKEINKISYSYSGSSGTYSVILNGDTVYETKGRRDCMLFIAELKMKQPYEH